MFFSNLTMFRFPTSLDLSALEEGVAETPLKPVGPLELASIGFVAPFGRDSESLVYRSGDFIWLTIGGEEKLLPGSVVNNALAEKLAELEKTQGRKLGGRARKQLKEDLVLEMLPKAFVKPVRMDVMIDAGRGVVYVNTTSRRVAESAVGMVRAALGSFPALPLNAEVAPRSILTSWIAGEPLPERLALGDDAELKDPTDSGATVKLARQELLGEEVGRHLEAGKQCARLAMTMDDHLSFAIGEDLVIRKVKFLDGALDTMDSGNIEDWNSELAARFALQSGTVSTLFDCLAEHLKFSTAEGTPAKADTAFKTGAMQNPEDLRKAHVEDAAGRAQQRMDEADPLYDKAVMIVMDGTGAGISRVQRVLQIGYNRAARLVEAMELAGVLSAPSATGERTLLAKPDATVTRRDAEDVRMSDPV